jgi:spore coat polysaccharide biosynthesis protein SpsF (cytidylyltransferase family)
MRCKLRYSGRVEDKRRGTGIAIWRGYGQQLLDRYYHALRKHSVASLLGGTAKFFFLQFPKG